MRCPLIIGRDEERAVLRDAVAAARRGAGATLLVLGEAGVGKSRLVADCAGHAEESGLLVLRGRAVDGPHPVTFRPLTEALLGAVRDSGMPAELDGFGPALARLLPGWGEPAGDPSLIAVAEGVLRLLRVLGRARGCLLVLEDLHWADPETLAVLEYLADHSASERLLWVATLRAERPGAALELATALSSRGSARRITLRRLGDDDVHRMIKACLGDTAVPSEVDSFTAERSDGLPFFIEELLAGLVNSGALVRAADGWRSVNRLVPKVPLTVAASIGQRLAGSPGLHEVLAAAAMLGRRFDWTLLAAITGRPEPEVVDALRAGTRSQLLEADESGFRFRHALTRDAVLAELLPPDRTRLASLAAQALEARYPELDGERCELAASLHEAAGDGARASTLLLTAADRAARRGALRSAESLLLQAKELGGAADLALLRVLALGGQTARVFELGESIKDSSAGLALARAAVSAGLWDRAAGYLVGTDGDPAATVLAAQVAMGQGRESAAAELAEAALSEASDPEVTCEALEILGRVVRAGDLGLAERYFERALATADDAGLAVWRLRALHELGTIDLLDNGRLDRLQAARAAAVDCGALATLAVIDLHLGDLLGISGRIEESVAAGQRCVDLSRRLGLATLPVGLCHLAGHHARAGRLDLAEHFLAEALELAPEDPDVLMGTPTVRAMHALLVADFPAARDWFGRAAEVRRRYPAVPFPLRGIWALLCTVCGDGSAEREEVRGSGALGIRTVRGMLAYADAVALGRDGKAAEAQELFAEADRIMAGYEAPDEFRYVARAVLADAALRDGWGDPVPWLRDSLAWAQSCGRDGVAAHCRAALKRAGAPVRRGTDGVPEELRALGVTAREAEVLALVAEGLSNAEIGAALFISPRTVEKHVEKLLTRTGTRTRGQLAVRAERLRMG